MRRAPQETRTYFATFVTAQRRSIFQVTATAELMLNHLQEQRRKGRIELYAFVIMPDHLHIMLTPGHDISLEKSIQYIKGGFSFLLKSKLDVWERSYNEVQITTPDHFESTRNYIETNPVRAHLASAPCAYRYSSAGRPDLVDAAPPWLSQG
ncbi:MAG TPA: transposase [Acidobacteriaceae bacterium]|nr:transposase [Acidobacteriaceae bacterium]